MKSLLPALALSLVAIVLRAQPQPCGPNPEMTSFCSQACIICDINGFTGINDDPAQGEAPPGFCTSVVHHMQWIGFIAGSTNLTLNVSVFGCQTGNGLEIGIYKSLDCQTFELVSNCDTDVFGNTSQDFTNTTPLTIGQYYYFVMDGNGGDVCSYKITVVSGTTLVGQLPNSGILSGDQTVCPGRTETYTVAAPPGAAHFQWKLDGQLLADGPDDSVQIDWTTVGLHNLCLQASNVCDTAPPVCMQILVQNIAPTVISATICDGECWVGADTTLCAAGNYEFHFDGHEGCDSTVLVKITAAPPATTNLDLLICTGDSIFIGGQPFFETGQFQKKLKTLQNGCDSLVNLKLQAIVCEIDGKLTTVGAKCAHESSGELHFLIENGTPPFQYFWEKIGTTQPKGTGSVASLNAEQTVIGLPAGTYFITVNDNFGHQTILFGDVTEPPPLAGTLTISDFHGKNVSCFGGSDGSISLNASGGTQPFSYNWNNGATTFLIENLSKGDYECTLTDAQGCMKTFETTLTEPMEIIFETRFDNPTCDGLNTGQAHVLSTLGGQPPYEFELAGGVGFSTKKDFTDLPPGSVALTVRDANGCTKTTAGNLVAPLIPDIELGPDLTLKLGDSTRLLLAQNVPLDTFVWSPPLGLSCWHCPEPVARPFHTTTYRLWVAATGGCTDVDSLTIRVLALREVFFPNVFSPNDDGANDFFNAFGSGEVSKIKSLRVFSRWGELIFEGTDLPANLETAGWNGTFRGKKVSPSVFTWTAEVEFIDGVSLSYEGDVTVAY